LARPAAVTTITFDLSALVGVGVEVGVRVRVKVRARFRIRVRVKLGLGLGLRLRCMEYSTMKWSCRTQKDRGLGKKIGCKDKTRYL
jgi:hypothetical protein